MDVSDLKGLFGEVKKRMDGHIEHVRRELGGVRTGRASVTLLDPVQVEAYGSMVPLNQVASLSIPEPAMTRRRLPAVRRLNTTIGSLLSMHSEIAVASITLSPCSSTLI